MFVNRERFYAHPVVSEIVNRISIYLIIRGSKSLK